LQANSLGAQLEQKTQAIRERNLDGTLESQLSDMQRMQVCAIYYIACARLLSEIVRHTCRLQSLTVEICCFSMPEELCVK
jgi:hypothetical protein